MSQANGVNLDEVFRSEWPKLVAILMRDFSDLQLAEDCAQEAFVQASEQWGSSVSVPDRPGAWLTTVARRKALDRVRRSSSYKQKLQELEVRAKRGPETPSGGELIDEQLALLLGCCHPALATEAQVALTLRIVAGLTTAQIARAFLVEEATMGKRLTRAKGKIRDANIPFRSVDRDALTERLEAVRHVVYLVFTEGHASGSDVEFVRGDLCDEAAWLASLLASLVGDSESRALLALILLTDARRSTRVDEDGVPVLLEDQDRSKWDRSKISEGLRQLERASGHGLGPYGLQATVASFHSVSPTFADTEWMRIVALYDRMLEQGGGAVVALNRAAALSYVDGPGAGLAAMSDLSAELDSYLYFHSARAELLRRLDLLDDARQAYERALQCHPAEAEAAFLHRQLDSLC